MIKTITQYQTEDGQCFHTLKEAEMHQACAALIEEIRGVVKGSGSGLADIAAWIMHNFERKAIKKYTAYIDRGGQQYKVEGSIVWMLDGGAWFESGVSREAAELRFLAGDWREVAP